MKAYLCRHGRAKSAKEDPERPLTEEGRREVSMVASFVDEYFLFAPETVVHSDKTRARQTAEVFAEELGLTDSLEEGEELAPHDDPVRWLREIEGAESEVMLVGHFPHLLRVAGLLITGYDDKKLLELDPGSVACLTRGEEEWAVQWMVNPEALKEK